MKKQKAKRAYKLKLSPKTILYLKRIKKKYRAKVSVGLIQDFNISNFTTCKNAGYYFFYDGKHHIYVNNTQFYRNSHDLIVLHEIGHLLMNECKFNIYSNQSESFANGFAFAKARELELKIHDKMIEEMCEYSDNYYFKNSILGKI